MRPANPGKTSKRAAAGRARLELERHLGWTSGFPAQRSESGLTWLTLDPSAEGGVRAHCIGRRELSRAERTANELRRDFPRIFPELVGEPVRWRRRLDTLLELVKPSVHQRRALPGNLFSLPDVHGRRAVEIAHRIEQSWPDLDGVLGAVSWAHAIEQERVIRALTWIGEHGEPLATMTRLLGAERARPLALVLEQLAARAGQRNLDALVAWLGDPRVHRTPTSGGRETITRLLGGKPLQRPKPAIDALAAWTLRLQRRDTRSLRDALRLFELTAPTALLAEWNHWWDAVEEVARFIAKRASKNATERDVADARKAKGRLPTKTPVALPIREYLECVEEISNSGAVRHHCRVLQALESLVRISAHAPTLLFMHWAGLSPREPVTLLLEGLAEYLSHPPGSLEAAMKPWARWMYGRDHEWVGLDRDIVDGRPSRKEIQRFFAALRTLHAARPGGVDERAAQNLRALIAAGCEPERAAGVMLSWHAAGFETEELERGAPFAVRIAGSDDQYVVPLVTALHRLSDEGELQLDDQFGRFIGVFEQGDCLSVLRNFLLDADGHRVAACERRFRLLVSLGAQRGCFPSGAGLERPFPGWISEYPARLQLPIARLAAVHPDAEHTVVALFGKDVLRPSDLRKQVAALRKRIASSPPDAPRLGRRIESLEQRLARPKLSDARLAKLVAKLDRAVDRAIFEEWEQRIDRRVSEAIPRWIGLEREPEWCREDRHRVVLGALARLRPASRDLALRLLRSRSGPPPWDLRDAPPNSRFLERLAARGVKVAPWLDGIGARTHGSGDAALTLELESDPLEIFHMGGHFGTCLSPGAFNFFSTVSNAADVNKRVLYARDARGRVQGRCLLALTDAGGIVTFHPYCHDGKRGFSEMVRQWVDELAAAMGTVAVPFGSVSTLVADDWYDDGPVDLTGNFALLTEGSTFRRSLASISASDLEESLQNAFQPLGLTEFTLPLVLALPEILDRPPLVAALVPILRRFPQLTDDRLSELARALVARGQRALAQELFGAQAKDYLVRTLRQHGWLDTFILVLVVDRSPSEALALLRRERRGDRRRSAETTDAERLFLEAEAHRALHRRRKALALYEATLRVHASERTTALARERIAELGGPIG